MKNIKGLIKSLVGIYSIQIIKDKYYKLFKTNNFREQLDFEKKSIDFYSNLIKSNDLVFDVGANFGNRVKSFLKLNAKVVAIEPQKACCKYLRKKYGNRITLIDKAVGSNYETKPMFMSTNSMISSFSKEWIDSVKKERYKDQEWKAEEMFELITLDSVIDKCGLPSFIKIDVEGYEYEVLKGLSKCVNIISFEYTIPEQTEKAIECINHIKKINQKIECNYSIGESMKYELDKWITDYEMIYLINNDSFSSSVGDIYVRKII